METILVKKRSCDHLGDDQEGPASSSSRNNDDSKLKLRAELLSIVRWLTMNPSINTAEYIENIDRAVDIVVHEDTTLILLPQVIACFMEVDRLPARKLEQFIAAWRLHDLPAHTAYGLLGEVEHRLMHPYRENIVELMILVQQFCQVLKNYDDNIRTTEGDEDTTIADTVLNCIWHRCRVRPSYDNVAAFNSFMDLHKWWADDLNWDYWIEAMLSHEPEAGRQPRLELAQRLAQIFVNNQNCTASVVCTEDSNLDMLAAVLPKLKAFRYTTTTTTTTYSDADPFDFEVGDDTPNHHEILALVYISLLEKKPPLLVELTINISQNSTVEQAGTFDLGEALRALPALLTLRLIPRNLSPDPDTSDINGLSYLQTVQLFEGIVDEVRTLHRLQNLEITFRESTYGECGGVSATDAFVKLFKMGLRNLKILCPPFEATVTDELMDALVMNFSLTTFQVKENNNPSASSYRDNTERNFWISSKKYAELATHYAKLNKVGRSRLWPKGASSDISAGSIVDFVEETCSLWPDTAIPVLHTMFCGNPVLLQLQLRL